MWSTFKNGFFYGLGFFSAVLILAGLVNVIVYAFG